MTFLIYILISSSNSSLHIFLYLKNITIAMEKFLEYLACYMHRNFSGSKLKPIVYTIHICQCVEIYISILRGSLETQC